MAKSPVLILLAIFCAIPGSRLFADEQSGESFEKKVTLSLDYLLYLPEGYQSEPDKSWPLIVFLHGAGERGNDLELVKRHGPPKRVEAGEKFPFIVASPQCPEGGWWTDQPVLELIDSLEAKYRVDANRIYLTGLSMGGYGTWYFVTKAPERFAAAAPICGGGVPYRMNFIKQKPIWAFHGAKDTAVPLEESERLINKLKEMGNKEAKLSVYPEAGHDSWTEAYSGHDLFDWFLTHSLNAAP